MFPAGVTEPKKVRLYARRDHFILQWWDPAAKRTVSCRVSGDLIDALAEARKIETRLLDYKSAWRGARKLGHEELVDRFLADLHCRANAGELAAATVTRYATALAHYRQFCERPEVRKGHPTAVSVNRDFRLALAAELANDPYRHCRTDKKGTVQIGPVFDALRAMFNWAADADRGNLLSEGFRNPFDRAARPQRRAARDPFGEPDITIAMATEFISACDAYQLPLFATLILYGLRASEPLYLFREHLNDRWLKVNCLPELDYLTKGQRDKRFPLVPPLSDLLSEQSGDRNGLIFTRRSAMRACRQTPLFGASLTTLSAEFRRGLGTPSAVERQRIRERLLREAGGLNYDQVEHEFQAIATRLKWPGAATLKDFRHLFSTCLENAGVPEFYRRYFMGQSPGRAAIVTYTHLNELEQQFARAVQNGLAPLVAAITDQAGKLRLQARQQT
jgi:integrase